VFGYPKKEAAKIAMREVKEFLAAKEMEVIFCCFSEGDKRGYEEVFCGVI
jgi:O-acetyl-ADP-ribose deacetylase (regulator of RNase III)